MMNMNMNMNMDMDMDMDMGMNNGVPRSSLATLPTVQSEANHVQSEANHLRVQSEERSMTPQLQDEIIDNMNPLGLGTQEDILKEEYSSCVLKCDMLASDLEVSAAVLEDIAATQDFHAAKAELKDIEGLQEQYNKVYLQAMRFFNIIGIATEERERLELQRKKFLLRFKNLRKLVVRVIGEAESVSNEVGSSSSQKYRLKIPKVEIQIFSGLLDEWGSFKRLFSAVIHKNNELRDHEKHQFLRSRLVGEPLSLIESLPLEGSYYTAAWDMLLAHYVDPLKRVAKYFDNMNNCLPMSDKRQSLRGLITKYRATVTALQITIKENPDIDVLSQFCIHSFLCKADKGTRADWEREMARRKSFASFEEFLKFMDGRCNAFERAALPESSGSSKLMASQSARGKTFSVVDPKGNSKEVFCFYCRNAGHRMHNCTKFLNLKPEDRATFINKKRLCRKCFGTKCGFKCRFFCKICHGNHNTILHTQQRVPPNSGKSPLISTNVKKLEFKFNNQVPEQNACTKVNDAVMGWTGSLVTDSIYSLLATTIIKTSDPSKIQSCLARALLDSASQFNFITSRLVKQLKLKIKKSQYSVSGINLQQTSTQNSTHLHIQSRHSKFQMVIHCLILDEIVDLIPSHQLSVIDWNIPTSLPLADPKFNTPSQVDLLLGLGIFWNVLGSKIVSLGKDLPTLRDTKFGWLVTGNLQITECEQARSEYVFCIGSAINELNHTLQRFWFLDESQNREPSFEEKECERMFLESTIRDETGRFIVRLPFKLPKEGLGHSKIQAKKRFYHLERKFTKNENFRRRYVEGMRDYIIQGHIKEVVENPNELSYYIPHHAVFKETSTSTKLRIVFDASMKTSSGLSLSQCLMVGPVVQSNLIDILIRFRTHEIVFIADIVKMYRQIFLCPNDSAFQRIFWRESCDEPLKIYEITTVAFGTASAPYLATRCLKALAEIDGHKFPAARFALLHDFYVDDILTGANTVESALEIQTQIMEVLSGAGFQLSKWCSNSEKILERIPKECRETKFPLNFEKDEIIKTLGILWNPVEDIFKIWVPSQTIPSECTKRQVLSIISSIFDPLGLIGPVMVIAKLIMQSLWKLGNNVELEMTKGQIDWDERLPENINNIWMQFASKLKKLNQISIPRKVFFNIYPKFIELHGFADASEKAYGAVIYLRSSGEHHANVKLICSKSRVSPLKKQSIPRLELCATLLLAELMLKTRRTLSLNCKINLVRLWSDSEITLHWIQSSASRWQTFVANRVQKIQEASKDCIWDHVNSASNPADLLSRGIMPDLLENHANWWNGPGWLSSDNVAFSRDVTFKNSQSHQLEARVFRRPIVCTTVFRSSLFHKYSEYWKLVRITALLMRFIWNFHWYGPRISGPLQYFEIEQALTTLIKLAQREYFLAEIKILEKGSEIPKQSPLSSLSVFLDARNIIRVGGRLQNANLSYEQRHPCILPSNHPLTKMIIRFEHNSHFHAGPQLLKSVLRRKFWILRQNSVIKQIISTCMKCIRFKANTCNQAMASLPKNRVVPNKPFTVTGLDYAGPFAILSKGGRHKVMVKAYIAIFVCFTTKAIHLEIVSDLTSESFLACLTRFISRRGVPLEIHSDNSTTFVGANNSVQLLKRFLYKNSDTISQEILKKGCQWHFIPPYSPHFGGLWEAGVKSIKTHLRTVLCGNALTFEQFSFLLCSHK
ncbi:hypothetical protein PGB90_008891 [Kerria lacca]